MRNLRSMCFCLKTPYSTSIVHSLPLDLMTNSTVTHARTKLMWHTYFLRHLSAFSWLGAPGTTPSLQLGAIWSREITSKKHRKVEKVSLHRPWEGQLLTVTTETRRQRILSNLPSEHAQWTTPSSHCCSVPVCEWSRKEWWSHKEWWGVGNR